jgi:hypothetical protein
MIFDYLNTSEMFKKIIKHPNSMKIREVEIGDSLDDISELESMTGKKDEYFWIFFEEDIDGSLWTFFYYFDQFNKVKKIEAHLEYNISNKSNTNEIDFLISEIRNYYTQKIGEPHVAPSEHKRFGDEYTYKWRDNTREPSIWIVAMVYYDVKPHKEDKVLKILIRR